MLTQLFAAAVALTNVLPTVSPATFTPGRRWTWDYRERADGSLYSTERYTVAATEADGSVWIEMSTRYGGAGPFVLHHRMLVSVKRCLEAFRNPADFRGWGFRMESLSNGRWEEVQNGGNNLAFEEKFNCDPFASGTTRRYTLQRQSAPEGELWRRLSYGKLPGSWYHLEGPNAGVAARKEFSGRFDFRLAEEPSPEPSS